MNHCADSLLMFNDNFYCVPIYHCTVDENLLFRDTERRNNYYIRKKGTDELLEMHRYQNIVRYRWCKIMPIPIPVHKIRIQVCH